MTHALKTWTKFYSEICRWEKNFEVRKFDRPFKIGEKLTSSGMGQRNWSVYRK